MIRGIADTNLFLKPGSGELTKLTEIFELTEAEVELFHHVNKHRGWSSAFLRLAKGDGGMIRIIPDPLTDLLMSQS